MLSSDQVAVSVRDKEKAAHLIEQGLDVRQGDFEQYETLIDTFSGVDKLLIGFNGWGQRHTHEAASKRCTIGQTHIVYTSVASAPASSLSLAEVHRFTEKAIQDTGIPYTILRNNWYLENEMGSIQGAMADKPWVSATGEGKIGYSLRREYAEAAANVLAEEGHDFKIYELSSRPVTQQTLAEAVEKAINRPVSYLAVTEAAYGEGLRAAGLPEFVVELLQGFQSAMRSGALDIASSDLEKLLGREPLSLEAAVAELVQML